MKNKSRFWVIKTAAGEFARDDIGNLMVFEKRPTKNGVGDIREDNTERYVKVEVREVK